MSQAQLDRLYKRWLTSPAEELECQHCKWMLSFQEWHERDRLCNECREAPTETR